LSGLCLANAKLLLADGQTNGGALITEGKIAEVLSPEAGGQSGSVDCGGLLLMPGLIDVHAHFRIPGASQKEDFAHGLSAALWGGFTTVFGMANTEPTVDTASLARQNEEQANALKLANYRQIPAVGIGLGDAFAVDFASFGNAPLFSNDGNNIGDKAFLRLALEASRHFGFHVMLHCEPETAMAEMALGVLAEAGGNVHFCHVSKRETVEVIKAAKAQGIRFTAETTPHYLFSAGMDYAVNPPIGEARDRESLLEAIEDGAIDIIATDHAPHTTQDKANGANGISGLDYAFSLCMRIFAQEGLSIELLSRLMSTNPAKLAGLNKGAIAPGMDADIILVDPEARWIITPEAFRSKSHNTPFIGEEVFGCIKAAIIGGEFRFDDRQTG